MDMFSPLFYDIVLTFWLVFRYTFPNYSMSHVIITITIIIIIIIIIIMTCIPNARQRITKLTSLNIETMFCLGSMQIGYKKVYGRTEQ
jgi:predicted RND superfamily exporter protein